MAIISLSIDLLVDAEDKKKKRCTRHVVEIEGLACYIPELHYVSGYHLINAYNLSVFSALAYAEIRRNELVLRPLNK